MKKAVLTDNHFCYVLFLEMSPDDFISLLKINGIMDGLVFLDSKNNKEIYQEAKERVLNLNLGQVVFDFDYDAEPFVFDKYINGKLDRAYKICIFEYGTQNIYSGQTSNVYCEGMPLFFDQDGNMIKNSLN